MVENFGNLMLTRHMLILLKLVLSVNLGSLSVCVCVRACVRACVHACVRACDNCETGQHIITIDFTELKPVGYNYLTDGV